MDYQLIANILLAVATCFALVLMIRWDLIMLQHNDYSGKQFMNWLQETDESYSTKRILPMATLVACATPWARESWMVVILLAITMFGLGIVLMRTKHEKQLACSRRITITFLVVIAMVAMCAISLFTAHFTLEAGMLLMLFTAFSYALVLGANLIMGLFYEKK